MASALDRQQTIDELRAIYKSLDDLHRRQAAMFMHGHVAAIDGDKIRLELLPQDSRTGKPFLSPWVQVQEAAGGTGTHFPIKLGDPMRLLSPAGELGPHSLAIRDSYTTDARNPAADKELVIAHGGCAIRMKDGELHIEAKTVRNLSEKLFHNEKNVGDDHKHTGVEPGGGNSSIPA
jgi:GpV Apex motif